MNILVESLIKIEFPDRYLYLKIVVQKLDCIHGNNNIVAYSLSWFPNIGNQKTPHGYNFIMVSMSEINDIE